MPVRRCFCLTSRESDSILHQSIHPTPCSRKEPCCVSTHYRLTQDVTRLRLPNGLTLLVKENHTAPVVALFALVKVGYFHEPDRLNGISHVIEHMMFKGTTRREENEQIAREVRALGGSIN